MKAAPWHVLQLAVPAACWVCSVSAVPPAKIEWHNLQLVPVAPKFGYAPAPDVQNMRATRNGPTAIALRIETSCGDRRDFTAMLTKWQTAMHRPWSATRKRHENGRTDTRLGLRPCALWRAYGIGAQDSMRIAVTSGQASPTWRDRGGVAVATSREGAASTPLAA